MVISYKPGFKHTDWQDNIDRVQAGGGNGFNKRFHDLEGEFSTISGVVDQVNTAIVALGQAPPPTATVITLVPTLVSTATTGWTHQIGLAQKPGGQTSAAGMMAVSFPQGATIQSLRATGRNQNSAGNNSLRITLRRQGIGGNPAASERVARVDATADPFDQTSAADSTTNHVDNANFKYFITAELDNAAANDAISLTAFQVSYVPAAS